MRSGLYWFVPEARPLRYLDKHRSGSQIGNFANSSSSLGTVHIITRARLTTFGNRHPDAAGPLRDWARVMRLKHYREHLDVRKDFPKADFIGKRKAVFNIGGNKYRLVVDLRYDLNRVYIRHIVTHAEYDRLIARKQL
jgi:mRNA interferase HigB